MILKSIIVLSRITTCLIDENYIHLSVTRCEIQSENSIRKLLVMC